MAKEKSTKFSKRVLERILKEGGFQKAGLNSSSPVYNKSGNIRVASTKAYGEGFTTTDYGYGMMSIYFGNFRNPGDEMKKVENYFNEKNYSVTLESQGFTITLRTDSPDNAFVEGSGKSTGSRGIGNTSDKPS